MIEIERLNTMRVRPDDEINSAIYQPAGEFALSSVTARCFRFPSERGRQRDQRVTRLRNRGIQARHDPMLWRLGHVASLNIIDREQSDFFPSDTETNSARMPSSLVFQFRLVIFLAEQVHCTIVQRFAPKSSA